MKYLTQTFLIFTILIQCGCGYIRDRGRDLADVFSFTATNGFGVTAQASAINTSLGYVGSIAGLEDGTLIDAKGMYTSNGE